MSPFPYNYPQWRNYIDSNYYRRTTNSNYYYNYLRQISQHKFTEPKNKSFNSFEVQSKYDRRSNHYNHWHHPYGVRFKISLRFLQFQITYAHNYYMYLS